MSHWPIKQIFFGVLIFVAWLMNAIASARKKAAAQREGRPMPGPHGTVVDPQAQEQARLRRVRDEAERKLAERKILMRPAPPVVARRAPPMVQAPILFEVKEDKTPGVERVVPFSPSLHRTSPNALGPDREQTLSALGATRSTPTAASAAWLEELREPATVRRAILLREILGPPVGLR